MSLSHESNQELNLREGWREQKVLSATTFCFLSQINGASFASRAFSSRHFSSNTLTVISVGGRKVWIRLANRVFRRQRRRTLRTLERLLLLPSIPFHASIVKWKRASDGFDNPRRGFSKGELHICLFKLLYLASRLELQ